MGAGQSSSSRQGCAHAPAWAQEKPSGQPAVQGRYGSSPVGGIIVVDPSPGPVTGPPSDEVVAGSPVVAVADPVPTVLIDPPLDTGDAVDSSVASPCVEEEPVPSVAEPVLASEPNVHAADRQPRTTIQPFGPRTCAV